MKLPFCKKGMPEALSWSVSNRLEFKVRCRPEA